MYIGFVNCNDLAIWRKIKNYKHLFLDKLVSTTYLYKKDACNFFILRQMARSLWFTKYLHVHTYVFNNYMQKNILVKFHRWHFIKKWRHIFFTKINMYEYIHIALHTYVFQKRRKNMLEKCPQIAQCTNLEKNCTIYECSNLIQLFWNRSEIP